MKPIRKNASLKTLAKAVRHRANIAYRKYTGAREFAHWTIHNDRSLTSQATTYRRQTYDHFYDLNEIADHLERLAGITEEG